MKSFLLMTPQDESIQFGVVSSHMSKCLIASTCIHLPYQFNKGSLAQYLKKINNK